MADKKGRVSEIILRNVSEIILYSLKNDLCKFASIHKVDLASDYSNCKIYVSHIQKENGKKLVSYLNEHSSLIRTMLSKKLDIYKTPSISFVLDEEVDINNQIDSILDKIKNTKKKTLNDL